MIDDFVELTFSLPGALKWVADNQALTFEESNEMLSNKMVDFMTGWSKTCQGDCAQRRIMMPLDDEEADLVGLPRHPHSLMK